MANNKEVISELLECRRVAREERNWSRADEIRRELDSLGWIVCDEIGGKTKLISKAAQEQETKLAEDVKREELRKKREERNKLIKLNTSGGGGESGNGNGHDVFSHVSSGRQRKQLRLRYRRQAKKYRCPEYAAWLVETFGLATLRGELGGGGGGGGGDDEEGGAGGSSRRMDGINTQCGVPSVLDVAGGHGDLAWTLCLNHGIATTV
jgi:hypothetical protein